MAVGLYVTSQDEFAACLPAAVRFARAFGDSLNVYVPGTDESLLVKSARARAKAHDEKPKPRVVPLGEDNVEARLLDECKPLEKLVIADDPERREGQARLAEKAACTTIRLLAHETAGEWHSVRVERDAYRSGTARRAGQRISEALSNCRLRITSLDVEDQPADLILIGTEGGGSEADDFERADAIRSEETPPVVGIVLAGHSRGRRIYAAVENLVQRFVPQMERSARKALTDDLQVFVYKKPEPKKESPSTTGNSSSRKSTGNSEPPARTLHEERFDFIAMIGASAALASLGLVQNSAAVIIGAMLVAPLMSPILAASLAIVHSHKILFWKAWRMIAVGFLFAFAISFLVGLIYPLTTSVTTTVEMASRCRPSIMDFLIGFAGGGAAAYARTRSQLSSALAGAAIAAALVPPVATAGLHVALALTTGITAGEGVATPAHPIAAPLLLFSMNVVSIMLAGSLSLWSAGVRSYNHKAGSRVWQIRTVVGLAVLTGAALATAHLMDVDEALDRGSGNSDVATAYEQLRPDCVPCPRGNTVEFPIDCRSNSWQTPSATRNQLVSGSVLQFPS